MSDLFPQQPPPIVGRFPFTGVDIPQDTGSDMDIEASDEDPEPEQTDRKIAALLPDGIPPVHSSLVSPFWGVSMIVQADTPEDLERESSEETVFIEEESNHRAEALLH